MKRVLLLAAVLLTLAVSVAIYTYRARAPLPLSQEELCLNKLSVSPYYSGLSTGSGHEPTAPDVRFTWNGGGRTGRKGALYVSFSRYKAEDGVVVEKVVESYKSRAKAQRRIGQLVAHASKVVEHAPQPPSQARKDRVHLVASSAGRPETIIAWTDGSLVYLLRSLDESHVLRFEQQVYRPKVTTID